MIDLIDGYKIEVLDRCYAIGKYQKETSKKTGETKLIFKRSGYYTTIQNALINARKHLIRDVLESFNGSLVAAIEAIRALDERFEDSIKEINF